MGGAGTEPVQRRFEVGLDTERHGGRVGCDVNTREVHDGDRHDVVVEHARQLPVIRPSCRRFTWDKVDAADLDDYLQTLVAELLLQRDGIILVTLQSIRSSRVASRVARWHHGDPRGPGNPLHTRSADAVGIAALNRLQCVLPWSRYMTTSFHDCRDAQMTSSMTEYREDPYSRGSRLMMYESNAHAGGSALSTSGTTCAGRVFPPAGRLKQDFARQPLEARRKMVGTTVP